MKNMGRIIVALDPGTKNTGWAKFRETKNGWQVLGHGTNVSPALVGQGTKVKWQVSKVARLVLTPPRAKEVWLEAYFPFKWHKSASYQLMLSGGLMTIYEALVRLKIKPKITGESRSIPPKVWKDWIRKLHAASGYTKEIPMKDTVSDLLYHELEYKPEGKVSPHAYDALGVGLFAMHHTLHDYRGVE